MSDSILKPQEIRGWRRALLWPLVLIMRLWFSTLKFKVETPDWEELKRLDSGVVFVLWHNRAFVCAKMHQMARNKRLWGMVSASKDGAWMAAFLGYLGVHTVRGSSSRMGASAARQLIRKAREGEDLGITVDGPRGPVYKAHPGAAWLVQSSGNPMFLACPVIHNAWRVNSWDGYFIPKPFSTISLRGKLIKNPAEWAGTQDGDTFHRTVEKALQEISAGTDERFGL